MRRIHVFILLILAVSGLVTGALVFVLRTPGAEPVVALPTLFVLPSETSTSTPTASPTTTHTPTPTASITHTATAIPTTTPAVLPTLATRVIALSAVMPGVDVPPTPTAFPTGTILLPAPPLPVEPLPDATDEPPPYVGWVSFESDHPLVGYSTPWQPRQIAEASRGQYHRSENTTSYVTFPFEGEGLRVRYVAARNMGVFEVVVDGQVIDTVDAYADTLRFPGTDVYFVGSGAHTLTLRPTGRKNEVSEGYAVGVDAVQVFRGSTETLIILPPVETPTPAPRAVAVEQIAAPPQIAATATPAGPQTLRVSVVIAYDENGNQAVDPAEGVADVSIRAVTVEDNQAVAQTFTDSRGYAQFEITTDAAVRIVVPYFSQVWDLSRRQGGEADFTLLLDPGNQPGLIP